MDHAGRVAGKWRRSPTNHHRYRLPLLLAAFILIALFISSKTLISSSVVPLSRDSRPLLQRRCSISGGVPQEKFLWYAPHSGFSNQLSELKNAILMAAVLNRTLIVPPVLDHHAVALGSCPKFRVLEPNELRFKVWNHSIQLIRDGRYISMADIIDLSSLLSASAVRFMDFRVFVSKWCDVNLSLACRMPPSSLEKLRRCGLLLSGYDGDVGGCIFASQEDCRTTVWTYQTDDDGVLDSFQADVELKKKRKIAFLRKRKDVVKALGPGSTAGSATVLALGSLFTAPYKGSESHIDIRRAPRDLIQKIEFLPFVPELLSAGKSFVQQRISAPFLCAQLRLLDGQFKNRWKGTFLGLQQKLEMLKHNASLPIHVFIMTDLPRLNWTGSYLGDLEKDSDAFKLFVLREEDELVAETAMKLQSAGSDERENQCVAQSFPDILLYMEETICSCASLGFVGTTGSTIADSIELMRSSSKC